MEKRLDCELEGVKVDFVTGDDLEGWQKDVVLEGVVPYGCALLKLYAGSMQKPFDFEGQAAPWSDDGEDGAELSLEEAFSYSAKRQASEQ